MPLSPILTGRTTRSPSLLSESGRSASSPPPRGRPTKPVEDPVPRRPASHSADDEPLPKKPRHRRRSRSPRRTPSPNRPSETGSGKPTAPTDAPTAPPVAPPRRPAEECPPAPKKTPSGPKVPRPPSSPYHSEEEHPGEESSGAEDDTESEVSLEVPIPGEPLPPEAANLKPSSPSEDFSSYTQMVGRMAQALKLAIEQSPRREENLIFGDIEAERTHPVSLSFIPELMDLIKEFWDHPANATSISKRTENLYRIHDNPNLSGVQSTPPSLTNSLPPVLTVLMEVILPNVHLKLLPLHLLLSDPNRPVRGSPSKHLEENRNSTFDSLAIPPSPSHTTRLSPYLHNWTLITNDIWVLNIITSGYRLEFIRLPPLGQVNPTSFDPILEEEILTLLQKGAIQKVSSEDVLDGFYSRYFLVPKKDGGLRPILDLRSLNKFLKPRKFKMVTLESILHLLRQGDWFVVLDLKDAYFHVTIHKSHRKYLRLLFNNTIFQFLALPFGLSTAPRTFTTCMAPVAAYLRLQGIQVFPYINDWLIVSTSKHQALEDTQYVLQTLQSLGLTVNHEKSKLNPSQVVDYIGARLDSVHARMFMPPERIRKLHKAIRKFRPRTRVKASLAQHLLGLMASTTATLSHARLKMRSLQIWLLSLFDPLLDSPNKLLTVTPELAQQLQWWTFPPHLLVGRPFRPLHLTTQVTTDASPLGWGAHCQGHQINALWSPQEKGLHINHLELLAIIKALRSFLPLVRGRAIQLVTDNTTAMFYVNKQGGTRSKSLLFLSIHLWEWCYQEQIYPVAIHIATTDNIVADELSRRPTQNHEWELDSEIFQELCHRWGTPTIDMFAKHSNKKCLRYASRAGRGPGSLGDAFMIPWHKGLLYLFPPIPLVQRSVVRALQLQAEAILIAPWWPRQPWFSLLLQAAIDKVKLPLIPHLITQDSGSIFHPDLDSLQLTAWRISRQ
ncbi:uncharacterized protein LOC144587247 [Pogona vitticeps]